MEGSTPAPRYLAVRLAILIFLGFCVMGAWVPVFSLHLRNLAFTPEATAWASATAAIASLLSPLIWGQIADRWLAMERCISLCSAASAAGLFLLARLEGPWLDAWTVFLVCLGIWFFFIPTISLTSSLNFRHLEHPERDYGKIRVWGTLGWIGINWSLTLWFVLSRWTGDVEVAAPVDFTDSLYLASAVAVVLAIYALTMPHTPPVSRQKDEGGRMKDEAPSSSWSWVRRLADAPLSAMRLFRQRSFVVYSICFFGLYITIPFPTQLNPLLLKSLGFDDRTLPTFLTISQSTEVIFLFLLPMLLARVGSKPTMLFGAGAWTLQLLTLGLDVPIVLILAAFPAHGIFICCFLVAGQVYVNRQATHDIRASAQGLLLFLSGSGLLLGHLLVGWLRELTGDDYRQAYLGAALLSALMVLVFLAGFSSPAASAISVQDPLVPDPEIT